MGSPIRKSPDHRLLASPRGLSQLATSFFACLRQGIHTHALSSLTIKLTPHTILREVLLLALLSPNPTPLRNQTRANLLLPVRYSVVKDHKLLRRLIQPSATLTQLSKSGGRLMKVSFGADWMPMLRQAGTGTNLVLKTPSRERCERAVVTLRCESERSLYIRAPAFMGCLSPT